MKTAILDKIEDERQEHMGVHIEAHALPRVGWAVFSGCEGEDPVLRAFVDTKSCAEALIAGTTKDGDDDVSVIFDGGVSPAYMMPDGRVIIGNDYRDKEAIAALADLVGIEPSEWGEP